MNKFENPGGIIAAIKKIEREHDLTGIKFRDINGRIKEVIHPSLEDETIRRISEDQEVRVRESEGVHTMSFGEYLSRLGIKYDWYFKAIKIYKNSIRKLYSLR